MGFSTTIFASYSAPGFSGYLPLFVLLATTAVYTVWRQRSARKLADAWGNHIPSGPVGLPIVGA